jgi:hypothetical protein
MENLDPRKFDDNYVTYFGYKINVKSTTFKDAKSNELFEEYSKM